MAYLGLRFSRNLLASTFTRWNTCAQPLTTSCVNKKIFTIQDDKDFEDRVLKSNLPVVVDFQASWCGPCRILEPRLETVVGRNHDKVHLAKVDIDNLEDIALKYGVTAVPHVLGVRNGAPQKSFTGVQDEDQIESFVNELIES